jgi:hypothetical protein
MACDSTKSTRYAPPSGRSTQCPTPLAIGAQIQSSALANGWVNCGPVRLLLEQRSPGVSLSRARVKDMKVLVRASGHY